MMSSRIVGRGRIGGGGGGEGDRGTAFDFGFTLVVAAAAAAVPLLLIVFEELSIEGGSTPFEPLVLAAGTAGAVLSE
jgi:hypothetical protein